MIEKPLTNMQPRVPLRMDGIAVSGKYPPWMKYPGQNNPHSNIPQTRLPPPPPPRDAISLWKNYVI